jgi:UDP-N-acetylglucosamine--N-acetylmuramyl-(pentapeptide) pyrophosphoryl-undecaprenol N-acetylglucosamine transferase
MTQRILFAGGGTGGHLYPGLAIARALMHRDPQVVPYFIGAKRGIEREVLPGAGVPYTLLDLHPLYRRTPWNNWRTLVGAWSAWRQLSAIAREQRPRAVVGTGGYAAGVALAWARAQGIPTMLHEPDSHPGLTTRAFAGGARALFLGFPEAADRLSVGRDTRVHVLGAPIEPPTPRDRLALQAAWGFPPGSVTVLVFGGSQGARAINEATAAWVTGGLPAGVTLIWATGRQQADAYRHFESATVRVRPYLSPIAEAYAVADVAITRAGAMSIAELCAWQIPAVLVPLPTAAQDHQTHNARATAASGAAIHLPQHELSAARLDATVRDLIADPMRRDTMRTAAAARAHPLAADAIAREILHLLEP